MEVKTRHINVHRGKNFVWFLFLNDFRVCGIFNGKLCRLCGTVGTWNLAFQCRFQRNCPTLHSQVDLPRGHASFVHGDALVPAGLIRGHGRQLQRQVVQDVHLWTQAGVPASSQPGQVEADRAGDAAAENGARARRRRHVPLDRDGRRRLCSDEAEINSVPLVLSLINSEFLQKVDFQCGTL